MNIAGVEIGPGQPCRTVCEIGNAHNGSLHGALRLIEAAREAGADLVKFQCYIPAELVRLRGDGPAPEPWGSQGWTMMELYAKAQTPHEWFPDLAAKCREVGIPWFSSVFGLESLTLLERLDCPAYKLAALDMETAQGRNLVGAVKLTGKPVLASVRDGSVGRLLWDPTPADLYLYCPRGYPQDPADIDPLSIRALQGFSYHGTSPEMPAAAALYGAKLIEAHFQADDQPSELEAHVSLTASQFRRMVDMIRESEAREEAA